VIVWFDGDSRRWSDGYRSNDTSYEIARITRCDICYEYFWVTDPTSIDLRERQVLIAIHKPDNADNEEFKPLRKLNVEEYTEALAREKYQNPAEERFIRTRLWWNINHPVRNSVQEELDPDLKIIFEENLEALIYKTPADEDDNLFLLAEMNRELGLFREAEKHLNLVNDGLLKPKILKMKEKIAAKDKKVFLL
jgi:hypothetical protein